MNPLKQPLPEDAPAILRVPILGLFSLWEGLLFCLSDSDVRRQIIKPWLYGILLSIILLFLGYFWLAPILTGAALHSLEPYGLGVFATLVSASLTAVIMLFVSTYALVLVLLLYICFQDSIAKVVLHRFGFSAAADKNIALAVVGGFYSFFRALAVLCCLLPFLLIGFLLGMIPFLTPIGLAITSWAIGVQIVEISWESLKMSFWQRIKLAFVKGPQIFCLGLPVLLLAAIPFSFLFLPPIAIAAGASFVARVPIGASEQTKNTPDTKNPS